MQAEAKHGEADHTWMPPLLQVADIHWTPRMCQSARVPTSPANCTAWQPRGSSKAIHSNLPTRTTGLSAHSQLPAARFQRRHMFLFIQSEADLNSLFVGILASNRRAWPHSGPSQGRLVSIV
jgi:hypothetical protein